MSKLKSVQTTSFILHIMAMFFMLLDHLWATVVSGNEWMTCVGRLAFPIFAFMIVEGYFHTKDLKKYIKRLFVFALISEIPFNLMVGGNIIYYVHQNVLWTFLIGILLIHINEVATESGKLHFRFVAVVGSVAVGAAIGLLTMVDYYHAGILTVLVFYFFRGRKWWCYLGQLILLYVIHAELLGGYGYNVELFGREFFIVQQSFALFSLIPIWLYRGKQGPYNKFLKQLYYWFYPVHMAALAIIGMLTS